MSSSLIPIPHDENLYSLDDAALAFFKTQTGIHDDAELKTHILAVQKRAYEVGGLTHTQIYRKRS